MASDMPCGVGTEAAHGSTSSLISGTATCFRCRSGAFTSLTFTATGDCMGAPHGSSSAGAADCAGAPHGSASAEAVADPPRWLSPSVGSAADSAFSPSFGSLPAAESEPRFCVSRVAALSCSCTSCALILRCSSGLSLLHGTATSPSASFLAGASVTLGPNTLCTSARTMLTTLLVPSSDSEATALAKAYLLRDLSNLIHSLGPPWACSSSMMRGTFSRLM